MAQSDELKAALGKGHDQIEAVLKGDEARLRQSLVDRWTILDVIAHINSWGILFLNDARYMAKHTGQPIPYTLYSTSRYDDENEALVERRRGWTVGQFIEENRALGQDLQAFVDSFGDEMPDFPAIQPWLENKLNIAGVLAYHARHCDEHMQAIEAALSEAR